MPFFGGRNFLTVAPENHQTAIIAAAHRRRHQRERSVNRRVEFCFVADASGHQTSRVERDKNRLVAFDLILARRQFVASARLPSTKYDAVRRRERNRALIQTRALRRAGSIFAEPPDKNVRRVPLIPFHAPAAYSDKL